VQPIAGAPIRQITANPEPVHQRLITEVLLREVLIHSRTRRPGAIQTITVPLLHLPEAALPTIAPARQAAAAARTADQAVQAAAAVHIAVPAAPAAAVQVTIDPAVLPHAAVHLTAVVDHRAAEAVLTAVVDHPAVAHQDRDQVQEDRDQVQEDQDQVHQDQDVNLSFKPGSIRDPEIPKNQNFLL